MKRIYTMVAAVLAATAGFTQTDSSSARTDTLKAKNDTIKVGAYIIIRKTRDNNSSKEVSVHRRQPEKPGKVSTNWWIFDLGFANVNDKTNHSNTGDYLRPVGRMGKPTKDDLNLHTGKTSNVNIWLFMQRRNLIKGYVNLKYGLGLEMFNYRYESNISYNKNPAYIFNDSVNFSKNKLYAGYISVPVMLNFNSRPGRKKALSLSAGISAGYLAGSHTKQVSNERGKTKTKGNLGLEKFRLAYVGELGLGPVHLFGSYSLRRLHEKGLEQYPYSFGIRFSSW